MALGPQKSEESLNERVSKAEAFVDAKILAEPYGSVVKVWAREIRLSEREWSGVLAPKYRAAGWRVAKWHQITPHCAQVELKR